MIFIFLFCVLRFLISFRVYFHHWEIEWFNFCSKLYPVFINKRLLRHKKCSFLSYFYLKTTVVKNRLQKVTIRKRHIVTYLNFKVFIDFIFKYFPELICLMSWWKDKIKIIYCIRNWFLRLNFSQLLQSQFLQTCSWIGWKSLFYQSFNLWLWFKDWLAKLLLEFSVNLFYNSRNTLNLSHWFYIGQAGRLENSTHISDIYTLLFHNFSIALGVVRNIVKFV